MNLGEDRIQPATVAVDLGTVTGNLVAGGTLEGRKGKCAGAGARAALPTHTTVMTSTATALTRPWADMVLFHPSLSSCDPQDSW